MVGKLHQPLGLPWKPTIQRLGGSGSELWVYQNYSKFPTRNGGGAKNGVSQPHESYPRETMAFMTNLWRKESNPK